MSPASINYKADWCIVVVAIKAPESVTDEHAVLLAAIKCHVMALEKRGRELRKPDAVALLEATLKERRRRVRRSRNFELRVLLFNLLPDEVGLAIAPVTQF